MIPRGAPFALSMLVAVLMGAQAVLGMAFPAAYRDVEWIRATWFGNDRVTLLVAVPLLVAALVLARRGSVRGTLLWLGLLGYTGYNYAFYLFGAALNAFFPLYAALVVMSVAALVLALSRLEVDALAVRGPARAVGGYLAVVGIGLAAVWLVTWAGYAFTGRPTPVEPEVWRLVAALDLTVMSTALTIGGVLLWRRRPWGRVVAVLASVQAALYLLVLSVNSLVAIGRGDAAAPGELPLWGPLAVATAGAAALLVSGVGVRDAGEPNDSATAVAPRG